MSHAHPLAIVTPSNPPPLNLTTYLNNYLLFRSFQLNFSKGALTHLPVYCPAFNYTFVAGNHYPEYRVPGIPYPVISVMNIDFSRRILFSFSDIFTLSPIPFYCHELKFCLPKLHNFAMRFVTWKRPSKRIILSLDYQSLQ
jgi:hypothetical protein